MRIPGRRFPVPSLVGLAVAGLVSVALGGCDRGYGVVSGEGTLTSHGGTVQAQCIDHTQVKIVGTDPAAGYTARIVVAGPANQASVVFENPAANDFQVAVNCEDYTPTMQEFEVEDTTITKN